MRILKDLNCSHQARWASGIWAHRGCGCLWNCSLWGNNFYFKSFSRIYALICWIFVLPIDWCCFLLLESQPTLGNRDTQVQIIVSSWRQVLFNLLMSSKHKVSVKANFGGCATGIVDGDVCWCCWRFWVLRAAISSILENFAKWRGTLWCKLLIFIFTYASFHEHVTNFLLQLRRHLVTWLDLTLSWIYFYQRLRRL